MSDDPGVLGNLPRSRPGRRSDKRGASAGQPAAAPKGTQATTAKATAAKRTSGASKTGARKPAARKPAARKPTARRPAPQSTATPSPPPQPSDPLSGALRTAGALAEVGVKTAAKVAGGVLKRLPRP